MEFVRSAKNNGEESVLVHDIQKLDDSPYS